MLLNTSVTRVEHEHATFFGVSILHNFNNCLLTVLN